MERPPLSVILATTEPWPELCACIAALGPQLDALGGELVVADGHGAGLPAGELASPARLRRVARTGASVFELRALAVGQARGEVVAVTEDHCVPGPDWARLVLAAHAANPDADMVAGAVTNGSPRTLMEWANFLSVFAEFLPPVTERPGFRVPPGSNVSYKRRVLPEGAPATGFLELELVHRLFHAGRIAYDDGPRVAHVQSHGWLGTPASHFHNGRSTVGLRGARPRGRALAHELAQRRKLPAVLVQQTRLALARKSDVPRRARASLPFVALLACCHTAGECAALVSGPGRSPARLN